MCLSFEEPGATFSLTSWDSIERGTAASGILRHSKFLKEKGFDFLKRIGRGGYGEVWAVRQHISKYEQGQIIKAIENIACKIVSIQHFRENS